MQLLILLVAVFFIIIAMFVPLVYSLTVFLTALLWFPQYLKAEIFTIDISVCRLLIIFVLGRALFSPAGKKFRLNKLDKSVIAVFGFQIIAGAITASNITDMMVNRAGAIFDMMLPYFAVRIVLDSRDKYIRFIVSSLIIAFPLAFFGLYQCFTGVNVYGYFENIIDWRIKPSAFGRRGSLYRSYLCFAHPIIMGLVYASLLPIFASVWYYLKRYRHLLLFGLIEVLLVVFASVSSGPYMAAIIGIAFLFGYRFRRYWKVALTVFFIGLLCIEIYSNRHWYDVFCNFTLNPATGWYRSRLMEVALFEGGMSGHWLAGYGYGVDPGWSMSIDGRGHTDIVNHYLLILSRFGLLGFIPFAYMNFQVFKYLRRAWKRAHRIEEKYLVWGLCGAFLALAMTSFSVSLLGPPSTIYFIMIGMASVLPQRVGIRRMVRMRRKPIKAHIVESSPVKC